jgi:transcriptional regulator with XRE-family HTH domain
VTPEQLAAVRQRLGLSMEGLAAELNLTPAVVAAWEAGKINPTRRAQRWLAWRGAMLDRDEALAASGLRECTALRTIVADMRDDPRTKAGPVILAHMASCESCLARKRYLAEHFPPLPPPPLPLPMLVLVWAHRTAERVWQVLRGRPPA